jgi:phosphoribosylformylglycinamidine synthase II
MPTPVELHLFDTMWSEHCSYKSSRKLLSGLPTSSPDVVLGPGEDAGAFRFCTSEGHEWDIVVAHESHNHPSQVLPVEGAATGVGGIVRDVYCMGARVTGVMDLLRFGDPAGPAGARSRAVARGVVAGIWQYGNALGVPNLGGDTLFHRGYDENCLVNVVAFGAVRSDRLVHSRVPAAAKTTPYVLVLVGKPTDSTGFGGATFASADLDEGALRAVQVADPFLKRMISEANAAVLDFLFSRGVEFGFKDLGAGGIACVSSELASSGGMGVELDLDRVPVSQENLPPEVIACSETQERYGLAVPEALADSVLSIYNGDFELPRLHPGAGAAVIGRFIEEPSYKVLCRGSVAACAPVEAITRGIYHERPWEGKVPGTVEPSARPFDGGSDIPAMTLSVGGCSRRPVFSYYDSEVQGGTVLRPGEADATVSIPVPGCMAGLAVAAGGNPWIGELDPWLAGASAVSEAVRNLVATGATPLAATDCLNYGSPEVPEVMWQFRRGIEGISEACRALGFTGDSPLPIVSGNVSFYNQTSRGKPIPPSPIVAVFGRIDDASLATDISLKRPGDLLVLFGPREDELGGSLYYRDRLRHEGGRPPAFRGGLEKEMALTVLRWIREGRVSACHDISDGGVALAALEMALATAGSLRLGARLEAGQDPVFLCSETAGYLLEVPPGMLPGLPGFASVIGSVTDDYRLSGNGWSVDAASLEPAWSDLLASVIWREE